MGTIQEFQQKLGDIVKLAALNHKTLTKEAVEQFFEAEELDADQLEKLYQYLKVQGVTVKGREEETGEITGEKEWTAAPLSPEEEAWLREYEEMLSLLPKTGPKEKEALLQRMKEGGQEAKQRLTEIYLPEVVRAAKELHHPQIFLGDMVQEGTLGLLAALEGWEEGRDADQWMEGQIRTYLRAAVEEQTRRHSQDESLVERVRNLEEAVKELSDGEDAKFSMEELSAFLDMEVEEIKDVLRLTGDDK